MKKAIIPVAVLLSTSAPAVTVPQVRDFVTTEIDRLSQVQEQRLLQDEQFNFSEYELAKFNLRLRAEIGFDIEVGKISLVPELELGWETRSE